VIDVAISASLAADSGSPLDPCHVPPVYIYVAARLAQRLWSANDRGKHESTKEESLLWFKWLLRSSIEKQEVNKSCDKVISSS